MKKYIIQIEEEPFVRQSALYGEDGLYRAHGFNSLVFDKHGLSLLDEVVQCKDCIWFEPDSVWNNGKKIRYRKEDEMVTVEEGINVQCYCEHPRWHHLDGMMFVTKEHYCSLGEEKR